MMATFLLTTAIAFAVCIAAFIFWLLRNYGDTTIR
jgi:hypothetical protein